MSYGGLRKQVMGVGSEIVGRGVYIEVKRGTVLVVGFLVC